MNEIQKAKEVLRKAGYFVDNLWHINDVKDAFECDDTTAQDILNHSLTNDYIVEKIFESIWDYSKNKNLNEKS